MEKNGEIDHLDYDDYEGLIEFLKEDMRKFDFWTTVSLIAAVFSAFFAIASTITRPILLNCSM